jgi:hypothetical protein
MKCNVGKTDKIIRLSLGTLIALAGIYFESLWGLVAIVPFATALLGFCPLYPLAKISTCKK